jgi:hypothetical protein
MLRIDGKIYLAYSGEVSRDKPQALLLKRAWESLRRSVEFRQDCQRVADAAFSRQIKQQFVHKWGVALTDAAKSFNEIVGDAVTIQLDDSDRFNDMYRRLYGDSFYGEDRVVQCDEFNLLYNLMTRKEFEHLSAIARGQTVWNAPLETLQRGSPDRPNIHLSIDVDENLIAILYKVQFIIRALQEARVQAGKAAPIAGRVMQQLRTLEEKLDADIVDDGGGDQCGVRHDY